MMRGSVTGIGNATAYLNTTGQRLGRDFQNEIIKRSKALAMKMQFDMNNSVDKGATNFTQRSILFMYRKVGNGVTTTIMVKNIQAQYLYDVIVKQKAIDKFIPTSKARLDRFGNITGLKKNLSSGRYKVVKSKNGKERLIDTSQKKKVKRVIGLRESKRRKLIYDFYAKAEEGARLVLNGIEGSFIIRKG